MIRVLGLAAALLGACTASTAPSPEGVAVAAPAPVTASSAAVRWRPARAPTGTPLLEAPARVVPPADGRVVVSAPLRARILAVHVTPGAEVRAGASLVEVALPEAAAAGAAYVAAGDQIAAHERRAAQLEALRAEGLARVADVAAIELELARLRGEREVAATALRAAGLSVGDAAGLSARGGRTVLRAPRDGLVVKTTAVIGATASPDDLLVEIVGGGSTRVEVQWTGAPVAGAALVFEPTGGAAVPARLVATAPTRDADGTTRAWLDVEVALPPGALGRVRAELPAAAAVAIPAAAIARDAAGAYVWRRTDDRPTRASVRVLATSGAEALVSGLAEGDLIASSADAVGEGGAP